MSWLSSKSSTPATALTDVPSVVVHKCGTDTLLAFNIVPSEDSHWRESIKPSHSHKHTGTVWNNSWCASNGKHLFVCSYGSIKRDNHFLPFVRFEYCNECFSTLFNTSGLAEDSSVWNKSCNRQTQAREYASKHFLALYEGYYS